MRNIFTPSFADEHDESCGRLFYLSHPLCASCSVLKWPRANLRRGRTLSPAEVDDLVVPVFFSSSIREAFDIVSHTSYFENAHPQDKQNPSSRRELVAVHVFKSNFRSQTHTHHFHEVPPW